MRGTSTTAVPPVPVRSVVRRRPTSRGEVSDRHRDLLTAWLFVVVWLWAVLPRLVQSLIAPKFRGSVGSDLEVDTPLTADVTALFTFLVIASCAVALLVMARSPRPAPIGGLVVALAPWLFLVLHDYVLGTRPTARVLAYAAVNVALWQLRPTRRSLSLLGYLIGVAAVLAVLMGLVLPAKGLFQSAGGGLVDEDKQILPIGILVGFLSHGNSLGQFIGLGIPLVGAIQRGWHRYVLLGFAIVAVVWSASRSSLIGIVLMLFVVVASARSQATRRVVVAAASLLILMIALVGLPLLTTSPTAFTNRGLIWQQSLSWWRDAVWLGLGSRWYSTIGNTSERLAATVFHGHNEMVQLLVTGGLVLAALVLAQLVLAGVAACRLAAAGNRVGVLYLIGLLATAMLEIPLVFVDNFGLFPVAVLPVAYLLFTDDARRSSTSPPPHMRSRNASSPGPARRSLSPDVRFPHKTP